MGSSYLGLKSDEQRDEFEDDAENEGDDLVTIGLFLKPGDVVELSYFGCEPVIAVFVQQIGVKSQFFSANGRWCHAYLRYISFAIPGCIDPALVEPLVPYLPTDVQKIDKDTSIQVPREVGAPVQKHLERLVYESEKIYRENAPVLDSAYATLADQTRTRMMTLNQIAKTLLAPRDPAWAASPASLLAVRKALHHNEFRFKSDSRSQRLTNVFAIRPKYDVTLVETVHDWIRQYEEHIALCANEDGNKDTERTAEATYVTQFIEKARRIVDKARKHRDPLLGIVGPSKTRQPYLESIWGEEFSSTDRQLINFLQAWVLTGQFVQMPGLYSACASLLHAVDRYKGFADNRAKPTTDAEASMDRATGFLFLQELGVLMPHENRAVYDEQLMLPTVRLSRNLELLNTRAEIMRKKPDFRDSMAELRHDWGSTDVYCIDGAGAKEIDDGISISKVPGSSSERWIHVHVANPTAFFEKTHVLSGLAAHMTETVYTPERTFPMLPTWVTRDYFSLRRNRPVLTFSVRVSESGEILEKKLQPGIVRKVTSITPAQVAEYLGEKPDKSVARLVVGGDVPVADFNIAKPKLSEHQRQELRDLYKVAIALWEKRKANGGIRVGLGKAECRVFERPGQAGLNWSAPSTDRSRQIRGDPIIEVTARVTGDTLVETIDASNIVEEIMLLACHAAASWCAERNIPAMYRGTIETPTSFGQTLEEFREQTLNPYKAKHGALSPTLGFQYMQALGRGITHSSSIPHKIIGYPSYVKVTSPLRRFSDMVAHWQIEAALRYEAQTGRKFDFNDSAATPRPALPFTQQQIQESIITLCPRERIISNVKGYSNAHWTVVAFMRAFYFTEAKLPETFQVLVRDVDSNVTGYAKALLKDFSAKVGLSWSTVQEPVELGDVWEAKIVRVEVFNRLLIMEPVRLVHRDSAST
jgi:hypothetical protein